MYFDFIRQRVYVDNYLEQLHKYRLVQKPLYVDYYAIDLRNSIISKELQGMTYEFINVSGVKYNLIKNYPLSQFTSYTRSTVGNEGGIYNDSEMECVFVQMDNIKLIPSTMDFVVINFTINQQNLRDYGSVFRVANVETMPILYPKTLYKIKLIFSGKLFKDIKNKLPTRLTGTYFFDEISKKVYKSDDYNILIESLSKFTEIRDTINNLTFENYIGVFGNSAIKM